MHDATSNLFLLKNASGEEYAFHDFDQTTNPPGLFAWHQTRGQKTQVTAYTLDDRIAQVQRSLTSGGSRTTEPFLYEYFSSGEQEGRLQYVTLRRQVDGGAWENLRRTEYEYYGSTDTNGTLGDLKRAIHQEFDGTNWQDKAVHYYRYWLDADAKGFAHGLKYVLEPESYARMAGWGASLAFIHKLLACERVPVAAGSLQLALFRVPLACQCSLRAGAAPERLIDP